jgi:acyl-CoA hydrolase
LTFQDVAFNTFKAGCHIPNAIAYSLDNKKDLGVHTEMLTDSIVHLAKIGVVTGAKKNHHPGKIVFASAHPDFRNELTEQATEAGVIRR